ncbi:N-(5'-phosphoribosyl)anthranilate isomerase [Thiomicrorhabdus immobilis]|uniref:N-(5'-phosphoribosyl)anthranilate isomerase n=1 Tax=Thiomicrorhabdus immobilis TaxID=2791037 RepID=A0ABN6D0S3_9GAMM|nr:phosphoribosylanthranilate isomerase [Thiomicrorhabdus immobilis]BCN93732.1 N-(5'-phosphoribosyl)anthranilate isomerase [Thiomicrorhabdus immobilis]
MTSRTRVKICGLTSIDDALLAVNAGADAIGLVFYAPSPRFVEVEQAAQIAGHLPAFVTKTALFVNPDVSYVEEVLAKVNIDLLQFHGDESAAFCEQFNKPYIKAVRMQETTDLNQLSLEFSGSSGLLLDAYVPGIPGGTGEQFNWSWIPKAFTLPIILAGGLTAQNVKQAIQTAQPWAVDVSGGVEASKGVKSPEKIKQFMQQVMSTVE